MINNETKTPNQRSDFQWFWSLTNGAETSLYVGLNGLLPARKVTLRNKQMTTPCGPTEVPRPWV